jgi:hypothetical protein
MSRTYTIYDPLVDAYRQVVMTDEQVELYYASSVETKKIKDASASTAAS